MKTIILMAVILTATIQTQSQTPAQIQTAQRYRNRPGTEKQAEMRQEAATAAAAESHTPEEWRRIRERQKVALDEAAIKEAARKVTQIPGSSFYRMPEDFGPVTPLRIVDGDLYDLSLAIAGQREREFSEARAFTQITGRVRQVLKDGLLLRSGDETVMLKRHPDQDSLLDNASISVFAVPIGRYQYASVLGAQRTVQAYDYGEIFDPKKHHVTGVWRIINNDFAYIELTDSDKKHLWPAK